MIRSTKKFAAVFTRARNERLMLPIWKRYYSRYFEHQDMYILDNLSKDGSTNPNALDGIYVKDIKHSVCWNDHWMKDAVIAYQHKLLEEYEYVLYTDVDEIIVPDPTVYRDLKHYIQVYDGVVRDTMSYEIIHDIDNEEPLDFRRPINAQRSNWFPRRKRWGKAVLANQPLEWGARMHLCFQNRERRKDPHLFLLHLSMMDLDIWTQRRTEQIGNLPIKGLTANHPRITDRAAAESFIREKFQMAEKIPEHIRSVRI